MCTLGVVPYGTKTERQGLYRGKRWLCRLIVLKSDTIQQLHSPLGVIRQLTLLINTSPHLSKTSPEQSDNDQDLSHSIK